MQDGTGIHRLPHEGLWPRAAGLAILLILGWGVAAAHSQDTVYVAHFDALGPDTVSVIDIDSGSVTSTIEVGEGPFNLAGSPDGSRVYVSNHGISARSVSVIDTITDTVIDTVVLGGGSQPNGIAVAADGLRVFVCFGQQVQVLDTDPSSPTYHTVVDSVGVTNAGFLALSPDGSPLISVLQLLYHLRHLAR